MGAITAKRVVGGRLYERHVGPGGRLTVEEAGRALHCSRRSIFYWIANGRLHPVKAKGRLWVPVAEVMKFMKGDPRPEPVSRLRERWRRERRRKRVLQRVRDATKGGEPYGSDEG